MRTRIGQAIISLIALITFVYVGASTVANQQAWDWQAFECDCVYDVCEWCICEWDAYHAEAKAEYVEAFDALFNSYETRWSKNNRLMMRHGDSGSFKFVKRSA